MSPTEASWNSAVATRLAKGGVVSPTTSSTFVVSGGRSVQRSRSPVGTADTSICDEYPFALDDQ